MDEKGSLLPGGLNAAVTPDNQPNQPNQYYRFIGIEISQDGLSASIAVFPTPSEMRPVPLEAVQEKLSQAGVVYGIDHQALARVVEEQAGKPEVVARGVPSVPGLDGQIEFNFLVDTSQIKPSQLANGKVDYYNLNMVQNVEIGDVVAVKTPPHPGVPGTAVTGLELKPRPGKEVQVAAGSNTCWNEENTALVSKARGHVVLNNGKVEVQSVYEQNGDVDLVTGNLNCLGSVIIKGSVKAGFTVRAAGDIEVFGNVDGGTVIAGGSIQVRKGILGYGDSHISAGKTVIARFIENARVEAGENIVSDAIMHSQVYAGNNVILEGRKGLIVGGVARAGENVTAKNIGSYLTTPTSIEAGVRPELRELYRKMAAGLAENQINMEKIDKAIKLLIKLEKTLGRLPQEKELMLGRLRDTMSHLEKEKESSKERLAQIESELTSGRGKVAASGTVFHGVTMTIGRTSLSIKEEWRFVVFCLDQGEIRTYPYS